MSSGSGVPVGSAPLGVGETVKSRTSWCSSYSRFACCGTGACGTRCCGMGLFSWAFRLLSAGCWLTGWFNGLFVDDRC